MLSQTIDIAADVGDHGTRRHSQERARTGRGEAEAEADPCSSVPGTFTVAGRQVATDSSVTRINVGTLTVPI